MTFREFTGKNVEEAIRTAMKEFSAELTDLDIEILSQGSRGILGVGGEEARILAAPKSAVAAAETVRAPREEPEMQQPEAEAPAEGDGGPGATPCGDRDHAAHRAAAVDGRERPTQYLNAFNIICRNGTEIDGAERAVERDAV